jgi:hypothetical protein
MEGMDKKKKRTLREKAGKFIANAAYAGIVAGQMINADPSAAGKRESLKRVDPEQNQISEVYMPQAEQGEGPDGFSTFGIPSRADLKAAIDRYEMSKKKRPTDDLG